MLHLNIRRRRRPDFKESHTLMQLKAKKTKALQVQAARTTSNYTLRILTLSLHSYTISLHSYTN